MRTRSAGLIVLVIVSFLFAQVGCSSSGAQTTAGSLQTGRVQINGLSIVPPGGAGWSRVGDQASPFQAQFFKRIGDRTYLLNAELRRWQQPLLSAEDVLAYLKTALREGPRQENMRMSFAVDSAVPPCASFDMQAEDSHSPNRPGITFDIHAHAKFCVHPKVSGAVAVVEYSRRAPKGEQHVGERDEGDEFIKNVQFTDITSGTPNSAPGASAQGSDMARLAQDGDSAAQYRLAMRYRTGDGVRKDDHEAALWFRRAAEQGYPVAQTEFGWHLQYGRGVPQDIPQAIAWYRKAAERGESAAQWSLGLMYSDGKGVPLDDAMAVSWFQKAAQQGDSRAQSMLASHYLHGKGVLQNEAEAYKWFRKAADQGDPPARFELGVAYLDGRSLSQDISQGLQLIRLSAEANFLPAERYLGWAYRIGHVVAKDDTEAVKWLRKAADENDSFAQYHLSTMYTDGRGLPGDHVQAYMWCSLAAGQVSDDQQKYVSACNDLAKRMTASEVADGRGRAQAWLMSFQQRRRP